MSDLNTAQKYKGRMLGVWAARLIIAIFVGSFLLTAIQIKSFWGCVLALVIGAVSWLETNDN